MKKGLIIGMVIGIVVAVLATTGVVLAQSNTSTSEETYSMFGMGNNGGRGGMMGDDQDGLLHDQMVTVFAEKLGITVEEINTMLDSGETLYSIALAKGLTDEEITTLMVETRDQAIDQAVADGTLTQTQADWMKSRSNMMGTDSSSTRGSGGFRGRSGTGSCMDFDSNP